MTRTSPPAAVLAAACAGLLLAACGGGGSDSSDKIHSSATAATPTTTLALTASPAPGGADRPSTALPKDLTMTFDWPSTGDAVLGDGEQYVRAYTRAAAAHDVHDPAYLYYSRDDALRYAREQITQNIQKDWAPTGLDRYYASTVSLVNAGSATLSFCEDPAGTTARTSGPERYW